MHEAFLAVTRSLRCEPRHYVLEGSIRVAGQRVRATVQLIDAGTGANVFADKFDRAMEDIFGVQDEIVEAIVGRLSFNLQDAAGNMRARNPTRASRHIHLGFGPEQRCAKVKRRRPAATYTRPSTLTTTALRSRL